MRHIKALKLTNSRGCTHYKRIQLQVGMIVRPVRNRRLPKGRSPVAYACSDRVVHAYASLPQAQCYDGSHCSYGPRGIVWLIELWDPAVNDDGGLKLVGRSYKVLKCIGRRDSARTAARCRALRLA